MCHFHLAALDMQNLLSIPFYLFRQTNKCNGSDTSTSADDIYRTFEAQYARNVILRTVRGAHPNAVVRTEVIDEVPVQDGRNVAS